MSTEEILIKLGIDQSTVGIGMDAAEKTVNQKSKAMSSKLAKEISRVFTNGLKGLFTGISLVGIFRQLDATIEKFKSVRDNAEELEKAFGKMSEAEIAALNNLAANSDERKKFWNRFSADAIASIDVVTRALATMYFEGMTFNEALDEMVNQDIAAEDKRNSKAQWERTKKAIIEFQKAQEDSDLKRMSSAEKIAFWEKKVADILREAEGFKTEDKRLDAGKRVLEIEEKIREEQKKAAEEQKKADESARKEAEKRTAEMNRQIDAMREQIRSDRERQTSMEDRFRPNVEELATSGSWWKRFGKGREYFTEGPFAGTAQEMLSLQDQAKKQFIFGNVEGAKRSIADYNQRYDKLAELGIIPARAEKVAEAQIQAADTLKEIHKKIPEFTE